MLTPSFERLKTRQFLTRAGSSLVLLPIVGAAIWWGGVLFQIVLILLTGIMIFEITTAIWGANSTFRSRKTKIWHIFLGIILSLGFAISLSILRNAGAQNYAHGELVFILAILIWCVDTFAYLGGNILGGPKCAPRISPNKTWSGTLSGLGMGTVVATILFMTVLDWISVKAVMLSLVLSVLAVMGDLLVSVVKRYYGIKDTSQLIPGHGGIWDRVDSFLLVICVMAIAVKWEWFTV